MSSDERFDGMFLTIAQQSQVCNESCVFLMYLSPVLIFLLDYIKGNTSNGLNENNSFTYTGHRTSFG